MKRNGNIEIIYIQISLINQNFIL